MTGTELIAMLQDKKLSTTAKGNALEDYVVDWIADNFDSSVVSSVKRTRRSGALHGDGDMTVLDITFDCKAKGECKNVNVTEEELRKVDIQAAKSDKIGVIITPAIKDGRVRLFATLSLDDLLNNWK